MSPKAYGKRCWAECLGGCSGGLSREHIISSSFFEADLVYLTGFDWTQEERREIGLNNAVSKVLCRAHNSKLSPLDSEVKIIRELFRKHSELVSKGEQEERFIGKIDGIKFERWLLKTTINVIRASPKKYSHFFPDHLLTQMAFGLTPFNHKTGQGLYAVDPRLSGNMVILENSINVRPAILEMNGLSCLLGSLITFVDFNSF